MDDFELMTNAQKRDHYIMKAKAAEKRASMRKSWLRRREERNLRVMYDSGPRAYPTLYRVRDDSARFKEEWNLLVDTKANVAASTDGVWKGAVGDNQWYTQYAQMYGLAALSDDIQALTKVINGR